MSGLLERARRAREALPPEPPPKATELQETFARDVGRKLGQDVDPLAVVEHGYRHPYYGVQVTVDGITFSGSYLWGGGDWRYHYAGCLRASIPRGRFRRPRVVAFHRLADLADPKPGDHS